VKCYNNIVQCTRAHIKSYHDNNIPTCTDISDVKVIMIITGKKNFINIVLQQFIIIIQLKQ